MAEVDPSPPAPKVAITASGNILLEWPSKEAAEAGSAAMIPPRYTIDLSMPPRKRYDQLCNDFRAQVKTLPSLFDTVVTELGLGSPQRMRRLARVFLRRVHSNEETEELRGISANTGIEMYLLVAFNVLLDLFMGCTSGGVRVRATSGTSSEQPKGARMLHFRTLDWGMDPLRQVIVQLDFVQKPHGPVVASTVTYAGYVGVLTGVKQGLSVSLNFRPNHDASTRMANIKFYLNHLLVLLGVRPSISSLLRQCLIPSTQPKSNKDRPNLLGDFQSTVAQMPSIVTTAAYIILCSGEETIVLEKDRVKAVALPSKDFVVATNHDASEEATKDQAKLEQEGTEQGAQNPQFKLMGMDVLVDESIDRKGAICKLYRRTERHRRRDLRQSSSGLSSSTERKDRQIEVDEKQAELPGNNNTQQQEPVIEEQDVIAWLNTYPTTNEETHYAVIMDPTAGEVIWTRRYLESIRQAVEERGK